MALTKVSRGLLSTGIVDNSNATAITIDASENVTFSGTLSLPNANATNEISFTGTEFTNVLSATTSGFQFGTTGAGYLSFLTNNTESMRINSAGNVGIGTDTPTLAGTGYRGLSISGPTGQGASITLKNSAGHTAYLYSERTGDDFLIEATGDIVLRAGGPERLRIPAAGGIDITNGSVATSGDNYIYSYSGGSSGDVRSGFKLEGSTNTLEFYSGGAERIRLTAGGSFQAKGNNSGYISSSEYHQFSTDIASVAMYVYNPNSGGAGIIINVGNERNNSNGYFLRGYSNSAARDNFYVYSNGNVVNRNNSFGPLSDQKLKQDIADANNQWEDFKAIKFRKFRFKDDVIADPNTPYQLGVVAQELEAAGLNGLVSESPDKEFYQKTVTDDDGNDVLDEDGNAVTEQKERLTGETTKSVKMSILYAKGMVALQEAMERIETLEAKVQQLENN